MSIQISRESWHFKLVKFFFDEYSYGLCQYARRLIMSMCLATCSLTVVFWLIWILFVLPIKFGLSFFYDFTHTENELIITYVSFAVWLFCSVCVIGSLIETRIKASNKNKPAKKPSVLVEYIKAKKQKVCPNIEFV